MLKPANWKPDNVEESWPLRKEIIVLFLFHFFSNRKCHWRQATHPTYPKSCPASVDGGPYSPELHCIKQACCARVVANPPVLSLITGYHYWLSLSCLWPLAWCTCDYIQPASSLTVHPQTDSTTCGPNRACDRSPSFWTGIHLPAPTRYIRLI